MRTRLIILTLAIAGVALLVYTCGLQYNGDGSYQLTVYVSGPPGELKAVMCRALGRRDEAELAAQYPWYIEAEYGQTADPFVGGPLTAIVPCSSRIAFSGRELSRSQFCYLVAIAVLANGECVAKLVDIPDLRVSREVAVTFP